MTRWLWCMMFMLCRPFPPLRSSFLPFSHSPFHHARHMPLSLPPIATRLSHDKLVTCHHSPCFLPEPFRPPCLSNRLLTGPQNLQCSVSLLRSLLSFIHSLLRTRLCVSQILSDDSLFFFLLGFQFLRTRRVGGTGTMGVSEDVFRQQLQRPVALCSDHREYFPA